MGKYHPSAAHADADCYVEPIAIAECYVVIKSDSGTNSIAGAYTIGVSHICFSTGESEPVAKARRS